MSNNSNVFKKILLCDDDEDECFFFKDALQEVDNTIKVTTANSGEQLFKLLDEEGTPDIVFLDLNMPRKSGAECLQKMRNKSLYATLPVIVYSTSANELDIKTAFESGANLYIQKTNNFSLLKSTLGKVLQTDRRSLLNPAINQFLLQVTG